jgi:hypothetical protein
MEDRMTRTTIPFQVEDISTLARSLERQMADEALPSHLTLMNMLARGAGFRNFQHLRAAAVAGAKLVSAPARLADMTRVAEVLRHFDAAGRMKSWPAKTRVQKLSLWALWSRLPARLPMTERQVSAHLTLWHLFGDAAILRRTMVETGLLTRTPDGAEYLRVEAVPDPEALALIRALPS